MQKLILLTLLGASATVSAATTKSPAEDFAALDLDRNGRLDWKEYRSRISEIFFFADANTDGRIDADEAGTLGEGVAIPADGLTHSQFLDVHRKAFEDLDRDGDGQLTLAEATGS
jgi:hypothetical protein